MAGDEREYEPEEDGSLEQFEEELLKEEKKKARTNFIYGIIVLLLVVFGGFYLYNTYFAPAPPPPVPMPAARKAPPAPSPPKPEAPAVEKAEKPSGAPQEVKPPEEKPAQEMETPAPVPKPEVVEKAPAPEPAQPVKAAEKQPPQEPPVTEKTAAKTVSDGKKYTVQVGFFLIPDNARRLVEKLEKMGLTPSTVKKNYSSKVYRIYAESFPYREKAVESAKNLAAYGYKPEVKLTGPGEYELYMGAFTKESRADAFVSELEEKNLKVRIDIGSGTTTATIVRLENVDGTARLNEITDKLKENKIDYFVVRKKG